LPENRLLRDMLIMGAALNLENGRHQLGDRALARSATGCRTPARAASWPHEVPRHRGSLGGKTATGIEVPPEVVSEVGQGRKRVPVIARIGSYSYRTTIAPMSGSFSIPVAAEHRAAIGAAAGDEIDVDLVPDMAPARSRFRPTWPPRSTHTAARELRSTRCRTATGGE
jgi:Domain of unknown function (DUF1905)